MVRAMLVLAVMLALPALAQPAAPRAGEAKPLSARDCPCRFFGAYHAQGTLMCVRGALARCAMDQNVPTWRPTGRGCPPA